MPLQQALASTEGIDFLSSSSSSERSLVTIALALDADGDRAMTDVLTKINQVSGILPDEANDPVVTRSTGDDYALVYLEFHSDIMSLPQIHDYLNRVVRPTLQTIPGVGEIVFRGAQAFAMRIWLDPQRMAAMEVTATDVTTALRENHFVSAAGEIKGDYLQVGLHAETDLSTAEAFENLVVRAEGDKVVRLSDIANVELTDQVVNLATYSWGERAASVSIFQVPGANALAVSEGVSAVLPAIFAQLPHGLIGSVVRDFTDEIRDSIKHVILAIVEAGIIVIVVVFFFLGNARAMLIPIVTIPLSLIGVMLLMLLLGYSLNLFTLLAMVLAVGLVVDDAIVVVENIYRHIEIGESPVDAAINGAREIARPVIAMTLTLAAVYAPIGFLGGLTGIFFREFAFTLAGAVLISGIVALTLAPMMASRLLKAEDARESGGVSHLLDRLVNRLRRLYTRILSVSLALRPAIFVVALGLTTLALLMFATARRELAPPEDSSAIGTYMKGPVNATLEYMTTFAEQMFLIVKDLPENDKVGFMFVGGDRINVARSGAALVSRQERERSVFEIVPDLHAKAQAIAGLEIQVSNWSNVPGTSGGPAVQFVLRTTADYRVLFEIMDELVQRATASGRFLFVDSDLRFDTPEYRVSIDHAKANVLGISMGEIGRTLSTLLGSNYVNRFGIAGRSYQVIPQVPREFRFNAEWLGRYELRTNNGRMVPLSTVVKLTRSVKPNALNTFQQLNSATLQGVPAFGQTLGDSLDFLATEAELLLPEGFSYDFQGESRRYMQEGSVLMVTFGFSLVLIFLVLAAQFESWRDPFIILIAVPLSVFGALIPITLGLTTLNIYTQIGLVTLIGLISKHGILIVEFAKRLQEREGLDRRTAVLRAASTRMRPILMTTSAMVMGVLPLITAAGTGAESRFAIGIVIASGVAVGTVFTLFVVPAAYTTLARR